MQRVTGRVEKTWFPLRLGSASIGVTIAIAVPALMGIAFGLAMPRGPLTSGEALASIIAGLAVGLIAGFAVRSRWAMLIAPVSFVLVFELVRLGTDGPTVGGIHTSTYGLIALVVGRGVQGLVTLLPMVLGATLGAALARRVEGGDRGALHGSARAWLYARRVVTGLLGAAVVALAVAISLPASTDPILGADGEPLPASVAELSSVEVGGRELALMVRGQSTEDPVLLFVAGGPGGSELGAMRRHLEALEGDFVVATWDQRGTGKSYNELDRACAFFCVSVGCSGVVGDAVSEVDA